MPDARWWEDPAVVTTRLAGTFEGGGAKGVAYLGALEATLEKGCWFGAVAGASAGAITATLIAAGLTIDELATQSSVAFTKMKPGSLLDAMLRLRTSFGALSNREVRVWLEACLQAQVKRFGVDVDGPVTFAALYEATGIELNVVAADLTRSRQVVFSVWDTPAVQVSDAVLASSAIPFVFPARHLEVPYPNDTSFTHTIVDGGVWSNFPTFVFSDRSYRTFSKRPVDVDQDYVVGYLLAEQNDPETDLSASRFRSLVDAPPPREWKKVPPAKSGWRAALLLVVRVVFLPMTLLLWLGSWLSLGRDPSWRGRWPTLGGLAGWFFSKLDDALSSLHAGPIAVLSAIAVGVGLVQTLRFVIDNVLRRLDEIRIDMAFDRNLDVLASTLQVAGIAILVVLVVAISILVAVMLVANWILLGPVRQSMFGVLRTYVAGPGAPIWTGAADEDNVIRLPIPAHLTTLSFNRSSPGVEAAVKEAIADARTITSRRLTSILASPALKHLAPAKTPSYELSPAPDVAPYPGRPLALLGRAVFVFVFASAIVFAAILLAPQPDWRRYDVRVQYCAQALQGPDDACSDPRGRAVFANVSFGANAAGHATEASVTVDDKETQRTPRIQNADVGRIFAIDLTPTCGDVGCRLTVNAFVDGKLTFRRTIEVKVEIDP